MDMVRGRVVDGEVQPGGDEGDDDGGGHGGGGAHGHGPWGQRPFAPSSSLEMVLLWGLIYPQDGCEGGGNFVVSFDLGFLSLYRLSDSRHPYYVFCISGFLEASELRLGRILSLNPPKKNSLQLCSFKFFHLRPSSSVSEAIFFVIF